MQRLVLALHNHQPVGNFGQVFQAAYDSCYRPVLDLAAEFPAVKLALHYTGPLLEWLEKERPSFLSDVKDLVDRGQIEILGGGFYEPMLAVLSDEDASGQILRMQAFCETHFGAKPAGMWLAERVWDPDLPRIIAPTGTRYTFLDDAHFFAAGVAKGQLRGHYVTEKAGRPLAIFPIDQQLRYLIPWKPVQDFERTFEALERTHGDDPRCLTYGDDGEKFGLWPGTQEWVFQKHWLRDFFRLLSDRRDLIRTLHPAEALAETPANGRVYLPTASYEEMGEWALPTAAIQPYEDLKQRLKNEGSYERFQPFVRAGIWQGFFAKYPESDHLHMRVLQASSRLRRLQANLTRPKAAALLREAEDQIYRSECNCAYWHGLFGGLYLNHLRHALSEALLKAERLLNVAERGEGPFLTATSEDLDADLEPEVTVRSEQLVVISSPRLGGSLIEISDLARAFLLTDVLSRREEGYHAKLRQLEGQPTPALGEPPLAKEPDLARFLVFDDYRRTSFLDRFHEPGFKLEDLRAGQDGDVGSFARSRYTASEALPAGDAAALGVALACEGQVRLGETAHRVRIQKRYGFSRGRGGFEVSYRISHDGSSPTSPLRAFFMPELNLTLLAGNAPDRTLELPDGRRERLTFRGEVRHLRSLGLCDGWSKLRVKLTAERPFDLWTYPVETVSQSEGGFERTYQGTCLLLRCPIELAPGGSLDLSYGLDLEHLA